MESLAAGGRESAIWRGPAVGGVSTPMTTHASVAALVLLAGLPTIAAAWALVAPDHMLSREMTWDLLFNLAGAWHLHHGQVAHVDFHDPVGRLYYLLTQVGFSIVGPTPRAFVVGATIVALVHFAAAIVVAWRRLPLLPAAIFVVFACLLVLMPANVGDLPTSYSFAMAYNRYGWSAISILALLLFVPPRLARGSDWPDMAVAAVLLVAMYYLKVTYFAVGLGALGLALLVSPHIRSRWPAWLVIGAGTAANAIAPYNHPYLIDIWNVVQSGGVRDSFANHLMKFLANAESYAPYVAAILVALWMWLAGRMPPRVPLAAAYLLAAGVLLLTQNAQLKGVPLTIVIAFIFFDRLRPRGNQPLRAPTRALLSALMIFPLLAIGTSALSIAGYHLKTRCENCQLVVDHTNLEGLAVPIELPGLLAAFAGGRAEPALFNRTRAVQPRYALSQYEYVETILEAATLLADARYRPGGIVVFDQVNPLPFMLGWRPARGGNLWSGPETPVRPAEEFLADVDHVLIPKFSVHSATAVAPYATYLARHFQVRTETQSWTMFSRSRAVVTSQLQAAPLSLEPMPQVALPP